MKIDFKKFDEKLVGYFENEFLKIEAQFEDLKVVIRLQEILEIEGKKVLSSRPMVLIFENTQDWFSFFKFFLEFDSKLMHEVADKILRAVLKKN